MSVFAHLTVVEAVKHEDSTKVTAIGTLEIIFDFLAQILIIGRETDVYSITGAVIAFISIIVITLEPKRRTEDYEKY